MLGLLGMVVMLALGVYSWFDPAGAMRIADLVSAFGETLTVGEGGGKLIHSMCNDSKALRISGVRRIHCARSRLVVFWGEVWGDPL